MYLALLDCKFQRSFGLYYLVLSTSILFLRFLRLGTITVRMFLLVLDLQKHHWQLALGSLVRVLAIFIKELGFPIVVVEVQNRSYCLAVRHNHSA